MLVTTIYIIILISMLHELIYTISVIVAVTIALILLFPKKLDSNPRGNSSSGQVLRKGKEEHHQKSKRFSQTQQNHVETALRASSKQLPVKDCTNSQYLKNKPLSQIEELPQLESIEQHSLQLKLSPVLLTPSFEYMYYKRRMKKAKDHYQCIIDQLTSKIELISYKHHNNRTECLKQYSQQGLSEITSIEQNVFNLQIDQSLLNALRQEVKLYENQLTYLLEEERKLKQRIQLASQEKEKLTNQMYKSQISTNAQRKQSISQQQKLNTSQMNSISEIEKHFACELSKMMLKQSPEQKISLFFQCRFLNGISKGYVVNEIKRILKKNVKRTLLLYSNSNKQEENLCLVSLLTNKENVVLLLNTLNKNWAIYHRFSADNENAHDVFVSDLENRKTIQGFLTISQDSKEVCFKSKQITFRLFDPHLGSNSSDLDNKIEVFWGEKQKKSAQSLQIYEISVEN